MLKEIYAILAETWGENASSYDTVKISMVQFKRGDFQSVLRLVLDDPK